jgi:hypothetical protein
MNRLMIAGAVLILLGLIGVAIPVFTTQQTKEMAKIGDINVTKKEETSHIIPPVLSYSAVGLGVLLIGAGLYRRR